MLRPRAQRFRLTLPGVCYLLLTTAFGLQALLTSNNLVFLMFALLAGFAVHIALFTLWMPWGIRAERVLPESVYAGDDFEYHVILHNPHRFHAAYGLRVQDCCQPEWAQSANVELAHLLPQQSIRLTHIMGATRRGRLRFQGVLLRCRLPFGLFEASRFTPVTDEMVIYPQRWCFQEQVRIRGLDELFNQAAQAQRFSLEATDFAGLREYLPSDHPRTIHWHASSRIPNQILTRQYEPRRDQRVVIILDSFLQTPEQTGAALAFEDNLCLAVALTEKFLIHAYEVRFIAYSGKPYIFPITAKALPALRRWLATLEAEPRRTLADFLTSVQLPFHDRCVVLRLPSTPLSSLAGWNACLHFTPDQLKPLTRIQPSAKPVPTVLPVTP